MIGSSGRLFASMLVNLIPSAFATQCKNLFIALLDQRKSALTPSVVEGFQSSLIHVYSYMELRDFISLLQKNVIWIVTCALIGAFTGAAVASLALLHPGWKAEVRITRELSNVPPALVLDGYYTIET